MVPAVVMDTVLRPVCILRRRARYETGCVGPRAEEQVQERSSVIEGGQYLATDSLPETDTAASAREKKYNDIGRKCLSAG